MLFFFSQMILLRRFSHYLPNYPQCIVGLIERLVDRTIGVGTSMEHGRIRLVLNVFDRIGVVRPDVRAAFAPWCGLSIDPTHDLASKRFFEMISTGRAKVPTAPDGENFIMKLAEILRVGPIASKVHEVHVRPTLIKEEGH